ncbi:hypothetical protein L2E82_26405 [Cichorium intybus]|uniref:Uncharacterized protein n=1 Tax=Cichorium intybus TaxID=13427 RepID=A0ACB9CQE3_CICIN|nr:hypothetical protein L2E82_26405 [Cichorium intybus]
MAIYGIIGTKIPLRLEKRLDDLYRFAEIGPYYPCCSHAPADLIWDNCNWKLVYNSAIGLFESEVQFSLEIVEAELRF